MTAAQWVTLIASAGLTAGEYIGGGVAAGLVVFAGVTGIRRGRSVLADVAEDRRAGAYDQYAAGEARQSAGLDVDPEDFAR